MTYITDKKKWYSEQIIAYQMNLYRMAISLLQDEEDAKDALQDALCTGYEKLNSLKDPDKFRPWMMQIVKNASYDILRKKKKAVSIDELESFAEEPKGLSASDSLTLREAIAKLPLTYRSAVMLFYYEDMSIQEISKITGVSSGVVKTRLFRARQLLKNILGE